MTETLSNPPSQLNFRPSSATRYKTVLDSLRRKAGPGGSSVVRKPLSPHSQAALSCVYAPHIQSIQQL